MRPDDAPKAPPLRDPLLGVKPNELCDFLRAKVSGAAHGDKPALLALRNEATTVYWCLLTMSPSGPDDGLAHANRCGTGRVCCVAQGCEDDV